MAFGKQLRWQNVLEYYYVVIVERFKLKVAD